MLSGLPALCSWQESWRDEDPAVNPDGILGTGVTGMGAPGRVERCGRHTGLEAAVLGSTLCGQTNANGWGRTDGDQQ